MLFLKSGMARATVVRGGFEYELGQLRAGSTIGEQALVAQEELAIEVDLTVVPMDGWDQSMTFDQTGLPFIRPSPNLPTLESLFADDDDAELRLINHG